ncbi:MAG: hypothetical protein WCK67_03010 [bacterium]
MLLNLVNSKLSFTAKIKIDCRYTSPEVRNKTTAILGASRSSEQLDRFERIAYNDASSTVKRNEYIITGCGSNGIMGASYRGAANVDKEHNLAVLKAPLWGDENTSECEVLGTRKTETSRINDFDEVAENKHIYPGGAATVAEAARFVLLKLKNPEKPSNITLIGKQEFKGIQEQYQSMENKGYLPEGTAAKLFNIVDSSEELDSISEFSTISKTNSEFFEEEKINLEKQGNKFFFKEGGPKTLERITRIVAIKKYAKGDNIPEIYLIGKEFYKGLDKQYKQLFEMGLLDTAPEKLYHLVDENEVNIQD